MPLHLHIFAGFLAGLMCALGGALKDSPYEGFKPLTFTRSIWVGLFAGAVVSMFSSNFYVSMFCSGYIERCVVEGWKIVRHRKPGKFDYGSLGHTRSNLGVFQSLWLWWAVAAWSWKVWLAVGAGAGAALYLLGVVLAIVKGGAL